MQRNSVFDVITGVGVRAGLKNLLTWGLDRARIRSPKIFNTLAWMHLTPEGNRSLKWFQTGLVLTGTWVDWIASHSKRLPQQAKEAVESVFQDLPGSFTNYFEVRAHEIVLPPDFKGPTSEEEVKALIKEFQQFLGVEMSTDVPKMLKTFKSKKASRAERFYRTMLAHENQYLVWGFLHHFFNEMTEQDQEDFLDSIEFFNDPDEFQRYMEGGPEARQMMLKMAKRLGSLAFLPTLARMYRTNYPKFVDEFNKLFGTLADGTQSMADTLAISNAVRQDQFQQRRATRVIPVRSRFPVLVRWVTIATLSLAVGFVFGLRGCM